MFLDTGMASPLNDAQRSAFEAYFRKGGGFVGIGSAIETDPSWTFLTDLLGTRSSGRTDVQSGTVKVADRVHDASKTCPQYWDRTDHFYNFAPTSAASRTCSPRSSRTRSARSRRATRSTASTGGTMGADHPVSWCKDYQGGRSFYTALGNTAAALRRAAARRI